MQKINENELQSVSGGAFSGTVFKYQMKQGDVLSAVAQHYNTTVSIICELNNIKNPDKLEVGQIILVPFNM